MTKKDESPEEGANPYWSDELLAVLAEALGDEDRARQTRRRESRTNCARASFDLGARGSITRDLISSRVTVK